VGRWSLVVGRWSLVVGRWSLEANRWHEASAQTRDLFCEHSVRCFDRARLARLSAKMFEHETLGECEFLSRRH
ncbi:MAG: hypothetical protein ACPG6R_02805, partial [Aequoribacter sp.]|uniref:hypothetical protein n=1 Tax=Aequoribacter sp. TaxID=2847771 RepID=UPI003C4C5F3E